MSKDTDKLGDRMKCYEGVSQNSLIKRTPVIIRIDGKAFHTFTRKFEKPFDIKIAFCMEETARTLCQEIQGVKLAYIQSDEISLLLTDYETFETQAWFDYNVQKLTSISASIATMAFNKKLNSLREDYEVPAGDALFDSRCFNLSKEEVTNYFYWRQKDAIRNSISAVAHNNFSQKELQGAPCEFMKTMLLGEGIDWDKDIPERFKKGFCIYYDKDSHEWTSDLYIPIWKDEGRNYIERFLDAEKN